MSDTLKQVEEIVCNALEIESDAERDRYIEQMCAGDEALLSTVRDLLQGKDDADAFFQDGCHTKLNDAELADSLSGESTFHTAANAVLPPERELGQRIGRYRLLKKIGEGGGGSVYLAEQEQPVCRQVALKVLRLGTDTQRVIARFEAERQLLAMMEHPNIALVLDAGATEDDLPFFVMEMVHGLRITDYCDKNHLDIPQRLDLFIQVCHAIQHAHHKGVIHRDIKPSNVLIAMQDGAPVPKVIDFGVAKAITGPLPTDRTLHTVSEQFVGTPAYMSPEQAGLGGADVDVRSDIYSLGVLLYELLIGKQPFNRKALQGSGLEEMLRTLREREPPRPSVRLASLDDIAQSEITRCRRVEPRRLHALLDGDLDWIVMKTLEKDRERRYQTVEGLAEDIQHYLKHEPVIARPPSRLYRFRKLVRRNKGVFASGAIICLTLIVGFGTSWRLYLRERELRLEKDFLLSESETREKITQAAVLIRQNRLAEADQLMRNATLPVIKPSTEAAGVFEELGFWNVTQGRWPEAADRYLKLTQANQVDKSDMSERATRGLLYAAPTLVAAGNLDSYRQLVQETLARFAGTQSPVAAEQIIKIAVIRPLDEESKELLWPLVDVMTASVMQSDESSPEDIFLAAWRVFALAGLEYRLGNYEQSVTWGNRSLAYNDISRTRIAMTHLILAMAHYQLGYPDIAHNELVLGCALVEPVFPAGQLGAIPDYGGRESGRWYDWVNACLLMNEAKALLGEIGTRDR